MTAPDQWSRIKDIVGAALEYEAGAREAFLDEACSGDEQLRAEADSLLAAYEDSSDLSSPGWDAALTAGVETPRIIGPYRLERELGVGGMGQVWLAEQTEPVHRYVAIKLVRDGLYDPDITQRFIAERQSLALMNHPAIAKIFDAGTTPAGQPYLVMEYVDGVPITDYCDQHSLSIAKRLSLFKLVCEGVQHAHQRAIIHRDLKPSNILVTEVDGQPVPRIIDFGVAKALARGRDAKTQFTQAGSIIGTLGYMSPEQADGDPEDIDTRSDVYSLGVLLYELLVGTLPLDYKKLSYFEVLRQLREQDAPKPSTRLRAPGVASVAAERRGTAIALLSRQLRGDADAIALKAIEKDRNRRYATPAELAADIDHYLNYEPVSAHAANFAYVARKYIRRHRVGVGVAAAGVLLLIGFAVMQTIQLRNTRRQRDRADRITGFMIDMFRVSDPSEARGASVTAREILDKSSRQIESGLGFDKEVQTQLMQVMAQTYVGLGLYGRAHELQTRTLENRRAHLGPEDQGVLESQTKMAEILDREGHDVEAEAMMRKNVDQQRQVLGSENALTLLSEDDLASLLERHAHHIEAEKIERQIIPIETRKFGPNSTRAFASMNTLGGALQGQSQFEGAEKLLRDTLDKERLALGPDHPFILVTMHNLANALEEQGRGEEAEVVYRDTLKVERRVLGPDHPDTASTMTTLANCVSRQNGRKAEAEKLYRESLAIEMRVVGPDHGYTTRAEEGLANVLSAEHRYAEAKPLLEEVLKTRQRTLGPDNTDTLLTGYNLAEVMFHEKRYADAEGLMRKTLAGQTRSLDANDPDTLASMALLSKILLKQNQPQEAEKYARQAFDTQLRVLGPQHDDTEDSLDLLAHAMMRLGHYEEAQTLYMSTIDRIAKLPNGKVGPVWFNFADLAADAGRKSDAFTYIKRAVDSGFDDVDYMRTDDSMKQLRSDPRYVEAMLGAQKASVSSTQSNH